MGQVVGSEVRKRPDAVRLAWPNDRQWANHFQRFSNLPGVLGILDQLHENETRHGGELSKALEPG